MTSPTITEAVVVQPDSITEAKTADNTQSAGVQNTPSKPSPAQDLRNLQMLLVSGIFPGNVAPQVVAGYHLLEQMAVRIEAEAKANGSK